MKSKAEIILISEPRQINVLLIGSKDLKQNFRMQLGFELYEGASENFRIKGKSGKVIFRIYNSLQSDDNIAITDYGFKNNKVFIFFNEDLKIIKRIENLRDKDQSSAFYFNSFNLEPLAFLDAIEDIILDPSKDIICLKQDINKAKLFTNAHFFDKESVVSFLPTDITRLITKMMFNQYTFFSNPLKTSYIALPPKPIREESNEEDESFFSKTFSTVRSWF